MSSLSFRKVLGVVNSDVMQHFCAYAASEGASKASRLFAVVTLARFLSPAEIGVAAAAMATSDIMKALTENGVGQRIIMAREHEVEALCHTAHRIFWFWCGGLFVLQQVLALVLWQTGVADEGALLVAVLGLEYLFMPGGLVQCALAMRAGRLKNTAAIAGAQNVGANLLTCALAIIWPSSWAVVLPKILTAPIWLVGMRRLVRWRPVSGARRAPAAPFLNFGLPVLGVAVLEALRAQLDKLIVGAVLGADALGIYYFAYNAGTGISMSLSSTFATVLFPYLSTSADRRAALRIAMGLSLAIITPVVLIQTLAAGPYVDLVFGAKWADVAPLVAILCLAAVPNMLWTVSARWLRSNGRTGHEFAASLAIGLAISGATLLAAPHGLTVLAWSTLAAATLAQVVASLPALSAALGSEAHLPSLTVIREA